MNLFTEIREGFGISWGAIRANKMRAVLTTLGIVIGIVTVTLMGTAIHGLNAAFLTSVSAVGTILDRSGQSKPDFGCPFINLIEMNVETFATDKVPPDLAKIPAIKPGSK